MARLIRGVVALASWSCRRARVAVGQERGQLLEKPHVVGKPLSNELTGYHSARRGAYRVIYRIDEQTRTVHVVRIDHRADVYHS